MSSGRTIAAATVVSGALDILFAMILTLLFGRNIGNMLRYVASGPFPGATEWGAGGAVLGLAVHFALMGVMAAIFVAIVRHRPALLNAPLSTGLAYGLLTYAAMNLVVVQLRFHPGFPPKALSIATQLFAHIVLVGIPMALIARRTLRNAA